MMGRPVLHPSGAAITVTRNTNLKSLLLTITKILLLWMPLVLVSPEKAFGYADPGPGAFLYQSIYAVFLGGSFYLRKLLDRIFGRRK
jgi:hypothetical protein